MRIRYVWMVLLLAVIGWQTALGESIRFGKDGKLTYDMNKGIFSIRSQGKLWLKDGIARAKNGETTLYSTQYTKRKFSHEDFQDSLGKGTKYMVTAQKEGLPDLQQIFYAYKGKDYLLLEVAIADQQQDLSSNSFVPLAGTIVNEAKTDLQLLQVPFDNDTFISYQSTSTKDTNQIYSAEVSAFYQPLSKQGYVIGSVDQAVWKTGVHAFKNDDLSLAVEALVGYTSKAVNRDDMPHGSLRGKTIRSAKVLVGKFADWQEGMDSYALQIKALQHRVVHPWTEATPVAWNSWGAMQADISYERATQVADFFADSVQALASGQSVYIDLDSYWDKLIKGGLDGDYSELKKFADYVKAKGLKPGAYWAPFVDWGYQGGPDRPVQGTGFSYGDIWTKVANGYHDIDGARALDPTHPGTKQRIALVIGKLKECGFEMIKIDFLAHAAIESTQFADQHVKTGMQAYRQGMDYLLKQLDGKMLVYAAISPNIATAPYVHMRRIACDAYADISATRYTLNGLTYGWWQTHLYDYIDADHVVFKEVSASENNARFLSAIVTGTVVFGDDYSQPGSWHQTAKKLFSNTEIWPAIANGKAFLPVESDQYASRIFVKHQGEDTYVALFNYDDQVQDFSLSADQLGLDNQANYQLFDLEESAHLALDQGITMQAKQARIFKVQQN